MPLAISDTESSASDDGISSAFVLGISISVMFFMTVAYMFISVTCEGFRPKLLRMLVLRSLRPVLQIRCKRFGLHWDDCSALLGRAGAWCSPAGIANLVVDPKATLEWVSPESPFLKKRWAVAKLRRRLKLWLSGASLSWDEVKSTITAEELEEALAMKDPSQYSFPRRLHEVSEHVLLNQWF